MSGDARSEQRYRRIALSTLFAFLARGIATISGLIAFPVLLAHLGKDGFGLWSAIQSVAAWAVICDLGLNAALVNAAAESHGRGDEEAAARTASTAFAALCTISILWIAAVVAAMPWVDGAALLGRPASERGLIRAALLAALVPALCALPVSTAMSLYAGYQRAYLGHAFTLAGAVGSLAGVLIAVALDARLPAIIAAGAAPGVAAGAAAFAYLVFAALPHLRPARARMSAATLRGLFAIALPLFFFQLGALLVNQSQALIITRRIGLEAAAEYTVLTRPYFALAALISVSTAAFLPACREAHERGDHAWVRAALRRMVILRMAAATAAAALLLAAGNPLLRLWLRRSDVAFDLPTWAALAVLMVSATWVSSFSDFLIVMGRLRSQVALVLVNGVITPALTVILAPRLGVLGAVIATALTSTVAWSWLLPVLTRRWLRGAPEGRVL